MSIRNYLIKINWFISSQLGLDIKTVYKSFKGLPFYLLNLSYFLIIYRGKFSIKPCLSDRFDMSGSISNEYFWQDLIVAQRIFDRRPLKHIDIGSKIDSFVAHVASYRKIECLDIRNQLNNIPNVNYHFADIASELSIDKIISTVGLSDSISCLHVLEHIGLGRYGDKFDLNAYKIGLFNISRLLKKNGLLYLSIPIGIQKIEFDANWIFNPMNIINLSQNYGLKINNMTIINSLGVKYDCFSYDSKILHKLCLEDYNLCIFEFLKIE